MVDRGWRDVVRVLGLGLLLATAAGCGKTGQEWAGNVVDTYDRSKAMGARGDMQAIAAAVTSHVTATGDIPRVEGMQELEEALVPQHARRIPKSDPWGNEYDYWTEGGSYHVASAGQDGEWETDDDLELSDGQMIRLPKGFRKL